MRSERSQECAGSHREVEERHNDHGYVLEHRRKSCGCLSLT